MGYPTSNWRSTWHRIWTGFGPGDIAESVIPVLGRPKRIYIVPTFYGALFSAVTLIIFLFSLFFGNLYTYLLSFLLLSILLTCAFLTNENIAGLIYLSMKNADNLFAGEDIFIDLLITTKNTENNYSIRATDNLHISPIGASVIKGHQNKLALNLGHLDRGVYLIEKLHFATVFPLGLFKSWMSLPVNKRIYVYPKADKELLQLLRTDASDEEGGGGLSNDFENFEGHQRFTEKDQRQRIDWKVYARTNELYVKQFESDADIAVMIDFENLEGDTEKKLQMMAAKIMQCESHHQKYGIKIDDKEISPSKGWGHHQECLKILAAYKKEEIKI